MLEANLKIINELKEFLKLVSSNAELVKEYSTVPNAFSRKRKISFERLVIIIARLCKKTLSVEIDNFFEEMHLDTSCTVSAFCQQRMKLAPLFYGLWNKVLCEGFYHYYGSQVKRHKGYRLIAVDGSCISLINTPELQNYFGGQSNQLGSFVQAQALYFYDVLNELTIMSQIEPYRVGELTITYPVIEHLPTDMIMIYDRNYCNYKMAALHQWQKNGIKFVIRAKETQNVIRSFIESCKQSDEIYIKATHEAVKGLRQSGYKIKKNTLLKVRLVRVELEKSVEVLMTNLWEDDGFTYSEFKELYFMRWGIETNISMQKNMLQLESFSGLSPLSVMQDFYATVFISNLHLLLIKHAQNTITKDKKSPKYPLKVNKNKAFAKLRANIIGLFFDNDPQMILVKLHQYYIRDPVPVRKNRYYPRINKNKQTNNKFKTFTNYKPAF